MVDYKHFLPTATEARDCANRHYTNCSLLDAVSKIINRDMNDGYYNTCISVEEDSIHDIDYTVNRLITLGYNVYVSLSDLNLNISW